MRDINDIYFAMMNCGYPVCKEWCGNKENFFKWCSENFYYCGGEDIVLDANLFSGEDVHYSPETCCFLPKKIKMFLWHAPRGILRLPNGISLAPSGKYRVSYIRNGSQTTKDFMQIDEAKSFNGLKRAEYAAKLAEHCKEYMPERVFNALMEYLDSMSGYRLRELQRFTRDIICGK